MSKVQDAYKEIESAIGSDYITDKDFMKAAYSRNVDPAFPDRWADMIVRPETAEEVSDIVKIANKYKIRMVPRGGGADLVGGSVTEDGILLDLTRMNKILEVNEDDYYCVVECGVTWGALLSELLPKGYTTGVTGPGSGYSATIGGGLSNSTAGGGSTKYGLVPDICLGVEVVLPNPQGTIIRTGSAANKYAKPFCRYGVAPDFTGLFMGDVGTLGIKTKAFLKLFPDPPYKKNLMYILNKNDYQKVFELSHEVRKWVNDGLLGMSFVPLLLIQMMAAQAKEKPAKRPRLKGPLCNITLEAIDERIIDVYVEKVNEIMTKDNVARPFDLREINPTLEIPEKWVYKMKNLFNYFHPLISVAPAKVTCTTCHKIPFSSMDEISKVAPAFDIKHKDDFQPGSLSLWAGVIAVLPNGNFVVVGGFNADNVEEQRENSMKLWHKKLHHQVRYGGAHYWLGESISQSIVEAGAYEPDFMQFFKDIKRTVDPNFLLSPNKFHLHAYDDDYTKYLVREEE